MAARRLRRSDLGVRFRERVRSRPAAAQRRRLQAEPEHDSAAAITRCRRRSDRSRPRNQGCGHRAGSVTASTSPSTPSPDKLNLAVKNQGRLGVGLQARSLTVAGAPYSYTIGAGDQIDRRVPNPGTYDLSLHGPNGFFRHFAGSPATVVSGRGAQPTTSSAGSGSGSRAGGGHRRAPVVVKIADAYGPDRHIRLHGTREITIDTRHSGGWYDIALSTPSDASFSYQLAGRLESGARLTSDPQLGR